MESEDDKVVRYERVIEKLRKMMEHERKLLKLARAQYQKVEDRAGGAIEVCG